ncbi:MAG: hypothetical protein H0V17_29760 [Deltaproteobacteria bacterium]|nr:hypothetical protein [Deltaproteobacteria bacterium]
MLLLPLVPALAFGLVEVADRIMPDQIASIERPETVRPLCNNPRPNVAPIEHPPEPVRAPEPCEACVTSL